MALLLSIESSTTVCSVALHQSGELLAYKENHIPQTTASALMPMIDEVCKQASKTPSDLQGVIISEGPGSYTGLRIGVATAKGICFTLQIPLVAINTLQLLAYQFKNATSLPDNALLCPMLDARRMEVYCMLLDTKLNIVKPTEAKVIDINSFQDELTHQAIYFFGNGAAKCKETINHAAAHFHEGLIPLAQSLGELGFQKFTIGHTEDIAHFEPYYLKDFMIRKPNTV